MNGLQVLLAVVATNAFVLGAAFLTVYHFNKLVSRSGR